MPRNYLVMYVAALLSVGVPTSLLSQVYAKKSSVDGFVTEFDASRTMRLGDLNIIQNHRTQCWRYSSRSWDPSQVPTSLSYRLQIPCDQLDVHVGSYVHAAGSQNTDRAFAATEIVLGNPLATAKQHIVRNWRFQDFFSGGPWNGKLKGGAFLEEPLRIIQTNGGKVAGFWVNGFPFEASKATSLSLVMQGLDSTSLVPIGTNNFAHEVTPFHLTPAEIPLVFPAAEKIVPGVYLSYQGDQDKGGHFVATKLTAFSGPPPATEERYQNSMVPEITEPNYETRRPGQIRYGHGVLIQIVPNRRVQEYVRNIGMDLVPDYEKGHALSDPTKIRFHFYVVRPFRNNRKDQFVQIDGRRPPIVPIGFTGLLSPFIIPRNGSIVDRVVAMPNGIILIPDTALVRLQNKAQAAFVMSAAIQSIIQKQAYIATLVMRHANGYDLIPPKGVSYMLTQQCIRNGIRHMYLGSYDIREAPFTWVYEQGESAMNPIIDSKDPDKEIPWYVAYAFNYINQYYKDVDYSKLKRGDAEYQEFLGELRKADPAAFAAKQ